MNRIFYLEKLSEDNKGINISKNEKFTEFIDSLENQEVSDNYELDPKIESKLRDYQKTGYKWLRTLSDYKLGGIPADEAQYIKNSMAQNATSLKKLNGEVKFALTGTPIENSIAELWSTFDFIMPGYLYSYNKLKKRFEEPIIKEEDKKSLERLKRLISPFVLRRVKKDVLTELPEKKHNGNEKRNGTRTRKNIFIIFSSNTKRGCRRS